MRRILVGSILAGWIAFVAGVTAGGIGASGESLLQALQGLLSGDRLFSFEFETARRILTGVVVLTLTVMLWATMIAVASDNAERRERLFSLGGGFAWVLAVVSLWMVAAVAGASPQAISMLFAIQMATLVSMLAAGGVEFAWEARPLASSAVAEEGNAKPGRAGLRALLGEGERG